MMTNLTLNRRSALAGLAASAGIAATGARALPLSETPKIGMGTWITFNIPQSEEAERLKRVEVLRTFFEMGGRMVDSSPMYGMAEDLMGFCLERIENPPLIAASKVWIPTAELGPAQMEASRELWRVPSFDLMQVHNLMAYEGHIETLRAMKAAGDVGAIGITTSHGRRHDDVARIMARDDSIDTVQLTYNMADREAERRLLPLATERGLKVIVNRPFQRGALIDRMRGKPLPGLAREIGVTSWAQFLLAWVISHPAVTVAIPATSSVAHMRENMALLGGPLPDAAMRTEMSAVIEAI